MKNIKHVVAWYPRVLFGLFCAFGPFLFAAQADAASLQLIPESRVVGIGEDVIIDVRLDTENESINAAQATIHFPAALVEVTRIDKTNSIFNFWIEEPSVSNETGTAKFIAGTPKGITGNSLHIVRLYVKAKASGSAEFSFSNAAITASDGKGTNVLNKLIGTEITVGTGTAVPPPTSTVIPPSIATTTVTPEQQPTQPPTIVIPRPQPVLRTAIRSTQLPATPILNVPFYPDPSKWYSHSGETIVLWDVPDDITQVAVALDQNPNTTPATAERVLLNGKNFGTVAEGIWYIHVRFKNNIGWGTAAHYTLSLDATPPGPFEVMLDNLASDNPSPLVTFEAFDSLSGISRAVVLINGKEISSVDVTASSSNFVLPPHAPGTYTLLVKVFDRAGNSVEDDLLFDILPLPTPKITFFSSSVAPEELLFVSGESSANTTVVLRVLSASRHEVFQGTAQSNNSGDWRITLDEVLPPGTYTFTATATDDRGAVSYATEEESFRVRQKVILTIGGVIDLGLLEIFIIAVLAGLAGTSFAAWRMANQKRMRDAYRTIASRDVEKFATMFTKDILELESIVKNQGADLKPRMKSELKVHLDQLSKNVANMIKYLGEEVRKKK